MQNVRQQPQFRHSASMPAEVAQRRMSMAHPGAVRRMSIDPMGAQRRMSIENAGQQHPHPLQFASGAPESVASDPYQLQTPMGHNQAGSAPPMGMPAAGLAQRAPSAPPVMSHEMGVGISNIQYHHPYSYPYQASQVGYHPQRHFAPMHQPNHLGVQQLPMGAPVPNVPNHRVDGQMPARLSPSHRPTEAASITELKKKAHRSFPSKLHKILANPEFRDNISWLPHGRAFKIRNSKVLEENILAKHFRSGRYESFMRQVS